MIMHIGKHNLNQDLISQRGSFCSSVRDHKGSEKQWYRNKQTLLDGANFEDHPRASENYIITSKSNLNPKSRNFLSQ